MRNRIIAAVIAVVCLVGGLIYYFHGRITPFAPSTVRAEGTVHVRGKTMPGIRVTYHPQFRMGAYEFTPNGTTDADGKFKLSSGSPGDGAPPGDYIVTFELPALGPGGIEEEIDLFNGKYSSPSQSVWKVKVARNSQETFYLD